MSEQEAKKAVETEVKKEGNGHSKLWQYFTAMMTEKKDGVMALSLTRVSAVGWGLALLVLIICDAITLIDLAQKTYILYIVSGVYGGLVGIKGVRDMVGVKRTPAPYRGPSGPGGM